MSIIDKLAKVFNSDSEPSEKEVVKVAEEVVEEVVEEEKSEENKDLSGYIYVISNRGSFGPDVYKIGATKRKDPQKRVNELGDASVPFKFDVHAFIKVDDVFKVESQIHRFFRKNELNKVNHKKEFYKVNLEDVKRFIDTLGYKAKWTMEAPALEYERSLNIESGKSI